jgi:hypothetical protein
VSHSHEHESEPNFEKLSKAITEAVMSSNNVKKVMSEMQKTEKICPQSFMVLVLKMQALSDALDTELEHEPESFEPPPAPKKRSYNKKPQFIDGQKLSPNELKFQEYRNKNFDSDDWLRDNGLIL